MESPKTNQKSLLTPNVKNYRRASVAIPDDTNDSAKLPPIKEIKNKRGSAAKLTENKQDDFDSIPMRNSPRSIHEMKKEYKVKRLNKYEEAK